MTTTALDRIIGIREVQEAVNLSRMSVYNRVKQGRFPKPIALGPRSNGWLSSEIQAWIDEQAASRHSK